MLRQRLLPSVVCRDVMLEVLYRVLCSAWCAGCVQGQSAGVWRGERTLRDASSQGGVGGRAEMGRTHYVRNMHAPRTLSTKHAFIYWTAPPCPPFVQATNWYAWYLPV